MKFLLRWIVAWLAGAAGGGMVAVVVFTLFRTESLWGLVEVGVCLAAACISASVAVNKLNRWLEKRG